jgi:CubicO group peptidase (beta-lactamase class C family)
MTKKAARARILSILTLCVVVLGAAAYGSARTLAATPTRQELSLRTSEPVEAVVADLESYIPEYMRQEDIPGVAIALIHDGEVVWTEGYGVVNTITRKPVTADTVFEVASNSKVVTAYIALRLVDQGILELDTPLDAYLPEPWLPSSEYRNAITLRHVLSHSSGLGQVGREVQFAPGSGYYYSAAGLQYLQTVIDQVTGVPLEDLGQETVFSPLGMSSSSYVNDTTLTRRTANGHLHAIVPVLLFALAYVVSTAIVGSLGLVIHRVRTGRWRPTRRMAIGVLALAYVLSLVPIFVLLGLASLSEFAWLIALCGLVLVVTFALVLYAGRTLILRLSPGRPRMRTALTVVWGLLIVVGLGLLASTIANLPAPRWTAVPAGAAGSVRATAGDMALFLIELADPGHLSAEMARELRTSQVTLSDNLSWGLGPGILHSRQGDALWQWGQHVDFQSIMVIYPEHGFGVVVCTNNDLLNSEVAVEIAQRALGGEMESVRQAIHLQYNYREES